LAFQEAGIVTSEIYNSAAVIGIAGLEIPKAKIIISEWQHPFSKMTFTSDIRIT
jgi:N-acetylglucosamine kinase-like BadF-type ATPase